LSRAIAKWLAIFSDNYRQPLGPTLPMIWSEKFGAWTVERFERACDLHLDTSRFFPTVADLKDADESLRSGRPAQPGELTANERQLYALYDRMHDEKQRQLAGTGDDAKTTTDENSG
jgi:hypothetical protein